MDLKEKALKLHKDNKGKLEVVSKVKVNGMDDLSLVYTPGVAEPCREIKKDESLIYEYTSKGNMVAVISDGSAVLGLGNIGAKAGMPVMEGKSVLFKELAGVDSYPICIDSQDTDEIVKTISLITAGFGGINLEDFSAPRCFEIEARLKEALDIPVFHDDQHGTAVIVLAGLINALKIVEKELSEVKIVVNGAGAASVAVSKFLLSAGAQDITLCDSKGIIYEGRKENMNPTKEEMAKVTNKENLKGDLAKAMEGADVFLGLSAGGVVSKEMVAAMAEDAIVFAMANPDPEIMPDEAKAGGARVVATGRSDFPNQINNCLGFPGIFKGALSVRASDINEEMKIAAAKAIASIIPDDELTDENIVPDVFEPEVVKRESAAVAEAARKTGVARI